MLLLSLFSVVLCRREIGYVDSYVYLEMVVSLNLVFCFNCGFFSYRIMQLAKRILLQKDPSIIFSINYHARVVTDECLIFGIIL